MTEVSVAKDAVAATDDLVVLKSVNKHFGALHVLQDIDLTIARGEVVVVIGPPGRVSPPCAAPSTGWSRSTPATS